MNMLREIVPDIFTWSEFSEEKQLNFNGYYLAHRGESVIIDPPVLTAEGFNELKTLVEKNDLCPLKGILITNAHHERSSHTLREAFGVPVLINEKDKDLLEHSSTRTFSDGDELFCGLKVINLENQKSPGESALLLSDRKILIVGDALIGKVPGKVNLLPPDKYKDIQKARKGLEILTHFDFEVLLVGDGEPILKNAKATVRKFLEE